YCKRKGNVYPLIYIVAFLVVAITHTCWGLRSYSMIFWTALALSVNRTLRITKDKSEIENIQKKNIGVNKKFE
ncbi:unnamed protein product, partial [marine sediment metagenome]